MDSDRFLITQGRCAIVAYLDCEGIVTRSLCFARYPTERTTAGNVGTCWRTHQTEGEGVGREVCISRCRREAQCGLFIHCLVPNGTKHGSQVHFVDVDSDRFLITQGRCAIVAYLDCEGIVTRSL